MSRAVRFIRLMHTSGRQIPNPGQGGAPQVGTTSPTPHSHHPLPPQPDLTSLHGERDVDASLGAIPPLSGSSSTPSSIRPSGASRQYTPKGKPIPYRPARTVSVSLPSGYPEPPSYPPPEEYFLGLEERRKDPHPLWQFFHVPEGSKLRLDKQAMQPADGGSLEVPALDDENLKSGRSWAASELRTKSFQDLHTLWYLLLKERNVLATQREERRRLGVNAREGGDLVTKRAFRCRKSMARIKYVLNERRLGLLAATSPLQTEPSPHLPFSASLSSDPHAGFEALRGKSPVRKEILSGPPRREKPQSAVPDGGVAKEGAVERREGEGEEATVPDAEVAKEEVESRDEGFGGGEEAKEFVRETEIKDGHVEKRA